MRAILLVMIAATCSPANSNVITLDADDYAPGTDITDAIPGAAIFWHSQLDSSSVYAPTTSRVASTSCEASHLCGGQQVFARADDGGYGLWELTEARDCENGIGRACREGYRAVNVILDRPTDYFSFDMYWGSDQPAMFGFDSLGSLIFSCFLGSTSASSCSSSTILIPEGDYHRTTMSFTRMEADVSRVMLGVVNGTGRLESVSVSVPEPATLALFGFGILGAVMARRRQYQARSG